MEIHLKHEIKLRKEKNLTLVSASFPTCPLGPSRLGADGFQLGCKPLFAPVRLDQPDNFANEISCPSFQMRKRSISRPG